MLIVRVDAFGCFLRLLPFRFLCCRRAPAASSANAQRSRSPGFLRSRSASCSRSFVRPFVICCCTDVVKLWGNHRLVANRSFSRFFPSAAGLIDKSQNAPAV
jgi:hypothetical protein